MPGNMPAENTPAGEHSCRSFVRGSIIHAAEYVCLETLLSGSILVRDHSCGGAFFMPGNMPAGKHILVGSISVVLPGSTYSFSCRNGNDKLGSSTLLLLARPSESTPAEIVTFSSNITRTMQASYHY